MEKSTKTSVLYNANCPVCNFEIGHYARYADKAGLPIRFDDLNTDARDQWGLDADTAARRLYVLHDGVLTSGISGALGANATLPSAGPDRWLARDQADGKHRLRSCAGPVDLPLAPAPIAQATRPHLTREHAFAQ